MLAVSDENNHPDGVFVPLTHAQASWLSETAASAHPPLSTCALVRKLLDEAIAESETAARRRTHQFEVYRASGYSEHHPDYPKPPDGAR